MGVRARWQRRKIAAATARAQALEFGKLYDLDVALTEESGDALFLHANTDGDRWFTTPHAVYHFCPGRDRPSSVVIRSDEALVKLRAAGWVKADE